jgi:hypothetical protein
MTELDLIVLGLVECHDGEWGWYQLDRALTARGIEYQPDLLELIDSLAAAGLLTLEERDNLPQPRYRITGAGRDALGNSDRGEEQRCHP